MRSHSLTDIGRSATPAYPGAIAVHKLDEGDELEWRRWKPALGNSVLVDIPDKGLWPGKVSWMCSGYDTQLRWRSSRSLTKKSSFKVGPSLAVITSLPSASTAKT
jgi:hypothetical protein